MKRADPNDVIVCICREEVPSTEEELVDSDFQLCQLDRSSHRERSSNQLKPSTRASRNRESSAEPKTRKAGRLAIALQRRLQRADDPLALLTRASSCSMFDAWARA